VVVGGEGGVGGELAGQQSAGQRDPGDDADPGPAGGGQHLVQRLEAEGVEDDLHAGHVGAADRGQRLLAGLHADAVGGDPLLFDQVVQGVEDGVVGVDRRGRAVQLDQVDGVHAEVGPGAVVPGAEVVRVVDLGGLRQAPSHLRGHGQAVVLLEQAAHQAFTAAVPVDVGGVEEGDAGVHRGVQRVQGV